MVGGGSKCGHYSSHSLGHYLRQAWALGQIWHWSKSLSNVAGYCYKICLNTAPINQQRRLKVHCLSFCVCRNVIKDIQVSEGLPIQSSVEFLCYIFCIIFNFGNYEF